MSINPITSGTSTDDNGWSWFDGPHHQVAVEPVEDVENLFARCFQGRDGDRALAYLKRLTQGRALGPDSPDSTLRHLEGQRHLVMHIDGLIERGRAG